MKEISKSDFIKAAIVLKDGCDYFNANDECHKCPLHSAGNGECQAINFAPCDLKLPTKKEIQGQIKDLQAIEKLF